MVLNIPTSTFSWCNSLFYSLCWHRSTLVLTGTSIPLYPKSRQSLIKPWEHLLLFPLLMQQLGTVVILRMMVNKNKRMLKCCHIGMKTRQCSFTSLDLQLCITRITQYIIIILDWINWPLLVAMYLRPSIQVMYLPNLKLGGLITRREKNLKCVNRKLQCTH